MVDPALKTNWPRRRAWAGILPESPVDAARPAGVNVTAREDLGLARILARRGGEAALSAVVSRRYGLDLPMIPRAVHGAAHVSSGPAPDNGSLSPNGERTWRNSRISPP